MEQFRPIDDGFISRNFNDRRKGKEIAEPKQGYYTYKKPPENPPGGSKVPRKPKPKLPPTNTFAIALKAGHHR